MESSSAQCTSPLPGSSPVARVGALPSDVCRTSRHHTRFPIGPALRQQGPDDPSDLVGKRDGGDLEGPTRYSNAVNQGNAFWLLLAWRRTEVAPFTRRDRSSVFPIFEMPPNSSLPPHRMRPRREPKPSGKVTARPEPIRIGNQRLDGRRCDRADARDRGQTAHVFVMLCLLALKSFDLFAQSV